MEDIDWESDVLELLLLRVVEDSAKKFKLRIMRRTLRDKSDPFALPEREFMRYFHVSKALCKDLCEELRPHLMRQRVHGLSVETQVLCVLRFLSEGSYQRRVGSHFLIPMCTTSVSRSIKAVCENVSKHMLKRWVVFPHSVKEQEEIQAKFLTSSQPFYNTIGALGCMEVPLRKPADEDWSYLNKNTFYSLNVQMICDPDLRILDVDARFPGSWCDATVWSQCGVRKCLVHMHQRGQQGMWLIGDFQYPLESFLMVPVSGAIPGTPEHCYNQALKRAYSVIWKCFSVLKGTWRCLSGETVLQYAPEVVSRIMNTCCVLHNMRIHYCLPADEYVVPEAPSISNEFEDEDDMFTDICDGTVVRNMLIESNYS